MFEPQSGATFPASACVIVSALQILLPLIVMPTQMLFGILLWRVQVIHLHCRILLFVWLLANVIIVLVPFVSQIWLLFSGQCLPEDVAKPEGMLVPYCVFILAYAMSTGSELTTIGERFVASRVLERYRTTCSSVVLLVVVLVSVVAVEMTGGAMALLSELRLLAPDYHLPLKLSSGYAIAGIIIMNTGDAATILLNIAAYRYGNERYRKQHGNATLNARYQMSEVAQLNRCTLIVSIVSAVMKCTAILIGYANIAKILGIAVSYIPPFYALIAFFFVCHTLNCGLCVCLFILMHSRMRELTLQLMPASIRRCFLATAASCTKRAIQPPEIDRHFSMLSGSWK